MITTIITLLGGVRAAVFAALLALALIFAGAQTLRLDTAKSDLLTLQRDAATALASAQAEARAKEQQFAAASADAAAIFEKGKTNAQANADALFANLLVDNVRLRRTWQCPAATAVPAIAASPAQPDAASADRAASASRVVRAAASCDAQVAALQALVRADRGGLP